MTSFVVNILPCVEPFFCSIAQIITSPLTIYAYTCTLERSMLFVGAKRWKDVGITMVLIPACHKAWIWNIISFVCICVLSLFSTETTNTFIDNFYWLVLSCSDILNWTFASLHCFHEWEKTHCQATEKKKKSGLNGNALCLASVGLHIPVKVRERRGHLEETGGPRCCWGCSANSDKCLSYYDTGAEPGILHVHSWGRRRLILPLYSATWQTSSGWWEY